MNIVITGANGFVGKNLQVFLKEAGHSDVISITRSDDELSVENKLKNADFLFHLAGTNRPKNESEFFEGNTDLTKSIVDKLIKFGKTIPVVYSSSIQAENNSPYGLSKQQAEAHVQRYKKETGAAVKIYRLPNVFGKWCKPNYNSAVATFCHNIANDLPITINDENAVVNLVYIDDVCQAFTSLINTFDSIESGKIEPVYKVRVGEIANLLKSFRESTDSLISEKVGAGFTRALYSTYISYFSPKQFEYCVPKHSDERGDFVEMLKTKDSGQFSYFTAHPGITRGGHYHHTKTEKFLVISGIASFKFRHILTGEFHEIIVSGNEAKIIETVPGWSHDVTNIGDTELVVMLWANEIFDREKPDTVNFKVLD